jgi:hemoglobin
VDELIDRVMNDPRLNANPRVDEAHHRVSAAGFKYLVTELVCWASGGPQHYSGRSMQVLHRDLRITATEWDAFLDDLQRTLDKFGVPQAEQEEQKAIWSRCGRSPKRLEEACAECFHCAHDGALRTA